MKLHIHCGDSSAESLRKAHIKDHVMVWCDPLIEGPISYHMSREQLRILRSEYMSNALEGALSSQKILQRFVDEDLKLSQFTNYDEVVLWFDACLFDQSILIRQLDWFAHQRINKTKISLICIGEFPGKTNFHGLGELNSEQLASLIGTRHIVTKAEKDLAQQAWHSFSSPNPISLTDIFNKDTQALPYLKDAIHRHCEQFPSTKNGLNRTENTILKVLRSNAHNPVELFRACGDQEERPFMGDTSFLAIVKQMASRQFPLVTIQGPQSLSIWSLPENYSQWTVSITNVGQEVYKGQQDAIKLNGVDKWVGGVHLLSPQSLWRWDANFKQFSLENASCK